MGAPNRCSIFGSAPSATQKWAATKMFHDVCLVRIGRESEDHLLVSSVLPPERREESTRHHWRAAVLAHLHSKPLFFGAMLHRGQRRSSRGQQGAELLGTTMGGAAAGRGGAAEGLEAEQPGEEQPGRSSEAAISNTVATTVGWSSFQVLRWRSTILGSSFGKPRCFIWPNRPLIWSTSIGDSLTEQTSTISKQYLSNQIHNPATLSTQGKSPFRSSRLLASDKSACYKISCRLFFRIFMHFLSSMVLRSPFTKKDEHFLISSIFCLLVDNPPFHGQLPNPPQNAFHI
jgi:hypothetical protein